VPNRGEVWLVDLGMAEKVRPALVLSGPFESNDRVTSKPIKRNRIKPGRSRLAPES
jgi:mRNA-degrading endonuclease toxin of MazEF toxin-antitoxin module